MRAGKEARAQARCGLPPGPAVPPIEPKPLAKLLSYNGENMAFRDIQDANLRRVIISSLLGATIEWYDFFLYGVDCRDRVQQVVFPGRRSTGIDPSGVYDVRRRIRGAAS